jgi:hypothetical protein
MHFKSLRHVRDHVKVQGRPYELLTHIALHTNLHTGEAFELTIERQAHRHAITPEWTRILLNGLIATGELIVERSRGRYPNRYRFPLERCPACQDANPQGEGEDDINPEVELGDDINPKLQPQTQPQTPGPSTPNSAAPQPVGKVLRFPDVQPQTAPRKEVKEVKELKEKKDGPTPNFDHEHPERRGDPCDEAPAVPIHREKAEEASPFYCAACGYIAPSCAHRVYEVVKPTPTGAVLRVKTSGGPAPQRRRDTP